MKRLLIAVAMIGLLGFAGIQMAYSITSTEAEIAWGEAKANDTALTHATYYIFQGSEKKP